MKLTMEDREMLGREYAKSAWRDQKAVDWAVGRTSGYAVIGGRVVTFDKPHIETRFCFGEHGYDFDEVVEECDRARRSEERFIRENMGDFARIDTLVDEARRGYMAAWTCRSDDVSDLGYVTFTHMNLDGWEVPRGIEPRRMDADELDAFAELVDGERAKFLKRLHAYLKRYGLSKCKFWTFWADR